MVTQEGLEPSTSCSGGKTGREEEQGLGGRRTNGEGRVYFVQWHEGGPLKIGWATDPLRRLSELQVASPVEIRLLDSVAGTLELERRLHSRLAAYCIRGEWFQPSDALLAEIRDELGAPEILGSLRIGSRAFSTKKQRREARAYFSGLTAREVARADQKFRRALSVPLRSAR